VNGTVYKINDQGIVWGLKEADAKKLLQDRSAWRIWDGAKTKPVTMPAPKVEVPAPEEKEAKEEAQEEIQEETQEETEETEETEEEWPDPSMSMTKAQLWEIADAYEVTYSQTTKKNVLVNLIEKAMYPDGK